METSTSGNGQELFHVQSESLKVSDDFNENNNNDVDDNVDVNGIHRRRKGVWDIFLDSKNWFFVRE